MITFDVDYYDLTLNDEPDKPDHQERYGVTIDKGNVILYGIQNHYLSGCEISAGRTFGTGDAIEVFGFEKFGNVYHRIKLNLRNMEK